MKWRYGIAGTVGLGIGAALMFLFTTLYLRPLDVAAPEESGAVAVRHDATLQDSASAVEPSAAPDALAALIEPEVPAAPFVQAAAAPINQETADQGQPSEGIKVHGHWTVDIREPDGTLVSHHEFENALLGTGGRRIAEILGRRMLPRYWGIRVRHNTLSNSPCILSTNNSAIGCVIYEPQGIDASFTSNNLVVTPTNDGVLILSGSIAAQRNGAITSVTTLHAGRPCAAGADYPDDCANNSGTEVTRTNINAINVTTGQLIAATVRISFE